MADGLYQSIICYFMPHLLYAPANFVTANGLNINDRTRMGVLVASAAVIASNTYVIMNTYRWDWLTVLINAISSLLIFFWTGVYSCFTAAGQFYHSAAEVYGTLSFWVVLLITVIICLLPRFTVKSIQKVFFPYDVDIVREWVTMGKYKYLDEHETYVPPPAAPGSGNTSATSSDLGKPIEPSMKRDPFSDDHQAMYPPSVTRTTRTHNPRSQNGSNGTNYTDSLDTTQHPHTQPADFVRNPQQTRHSFDRDLPSYEATNDFSTTGTHIQQIPHTPLKGRDDPPLQVV